MDEQSQQAAFSRENCLFCQIIESKIPSRKVYEDESVFAVLDINPANAGHVLVMPKGHFIFMPQVPPDILGKVFSAGKNLSQASLRAVKSDGTTIFVANGGIAGQRAPHFMIHVIPRLAGDGLALTPLENDIAPEVQSQVKLQLQEILASRHGLPAPQGQEEKAMPKKPAGKKAKKAAGVKAEPKKSDLDSITGLLLKNG